jgi:hypothetical protein
VARSSVPEQTAVPAVGEGAATPRPTTVGDENKRRSLPDGNTTTGAPTRIFQRLATDDFCYLYPVGDTIDDLIEEVIVDAYGP